MGLFTAAALMCYSNPVGSQPDSLCRERERAAEKAAVGGVPRGLRNIAVDKEGEDNT